MAKLLSFVLSGSLVSDLPVIELDQLQGSSSFAIIEDADPIPSGYQDISAICSWSMNADNVSKDYKYVRQQIGILAQTKLAVEGWASFSQVQKSCSADYFVVDKVYRDDVYTTEQQIELGLTFHKRSTEARELRLNRASMEIYNRLTAAEAQEIINEVETDNLAHSYVQFGREGTVEGDTEGLFDYLEGRASSSYSGSGMVNKPFSPQGLADMSALVTQSMDILKHGRY